MNKKLIPALVIGSCGMFIAVVLSQVAQPARPLNGLVPAGPLLYLEAKDFSGLLTRWRGSEEAQKWLESANYDAFENSQLFLRLGEVYKGYASSAGFTPDVSMLASIAGSESALALYDIGNLEFLYITRLVSARVVQTALWRSRNAFTPRKAGGLDFYSKTDSEGRVIAFAATDGLFLLATREDLIAGALELMSQAPRNRMVDEGWYARPISAAGPPGDLRLVMDFTALARSPHFRSYWIQRNVSLVRQYTSGVSDLISSGAAFREERLFLRAAPASVDAANDTGPLMEALRLVPSDAGFYSGVASPDPEQALQLLSSNLLSPALPRGERNPLIAPGANATARAAGSESDLDARIDEPEYSESGGHLLPDVIRDLFTANRPIAMIQVEETRPAADGVFIGSNRALILTGQSNWNENGVREAIRSAIEEIWTTAHLGNNWTEVSSGAVRYSALDGLVPLAVAFRGRQMVVSNSQALLARMLANSAGPLPSVSGTYVAGFRHESERRNFGQLMRLLDNVRMPGETGDGTPRAFFSDNLASLSETLSRISSVTISATDQAEATRQTVIYTVAP
jgi:hypothetical protein